MKLREEEFYEQYHQHGGTTIIPTEIFNELYDDATEEIERLNNIINEVRKYIEKYTRWFDSEYTKTYGELCTCAGANDTRLEVLVNPSNLLEILDKVSNNEIKI